jgi:hypothetical protein
MAVVIFGYVISISALLGTFSEWTAEFEQEDAQDLKKAMKDYLVYKRATEAEVIIDVIGKYLGDIPNASRLFFDVFRDGASDREPCLYLSAFKPIDSDDDIEANEAISLLDDRKAIKALKDSAQLLGLRGKAVLQAIQGTDADGSGL